MAALYSVWELGVFGIVIPMVVPTYYIGGALLKKANGDAYVWKNVVIGGGLLGVEYIGVIWVKIYLGHILVQNIC